MRDFKNKMVAITFQANALLITNPRFLSFAGKREQFIYTFNLHVKFLYSSFTVFKSQNHCKI